MLEPALFLLISFLLVMLVVYLWASQRNLIKNRALTPKEYLWKLKQISPDGHFKIPHVWPGQNPPPEVRSYPLATEQNKSIDFGLKDPYFFYFSSRAFLFEHRQPDGSLLETVASAFKLE